MKLFWLKRLKDIHGVSGTGVVAEGVVFENGKCALNWLTPTSSVGIYDNMEVLEKIHGHEGKTKIIFKRRKSE